ncbi:MlaD family protein [Mycobacterium syngnathidarum]
MLTRFVRIQLIVFSIASLIGMSTMALVYLQVPTWLGIGHISVNLDLPATGGLYRFGNVTYRGVQVGKVSAVTPTAEGAVASLTLQSDPKIPADVQANVHSVSAVGEQYVDLVPRHDGPPFISDGARIPRTNITLPQAVGPVLDQLNTLVGSVPKDSVSKLLDESFQALNGAGDDLSSLLNSSSRIAADANGTADQTRTLIDDSTHLLDSQLQSTQALRTWARSLADATTVIVNNDENLRTTLREGPNAIDEVTRLLSQIKPTLPVLLANLTAIGKVAVTYNASLRQLLVLLPPYVGAFGSLSQLNNPTGQSLGGFGLMAGDPPACTVGFLPPSQWRSPDDETTIDTPDGLYCKLPQDSPIAVRGVRNNPCIEHPGKRAPTVEICNSDQPYAPLAVRQHVLGPYPFDPNLLAQGVPMDSRARSGDGLYGPVDGTPPPATPQAPGVPSASPQPPPIGPGAHQGPDGAPGPQGQGPTPAAAPSSYTQTQTPAVAFANYDPRTGRYVGADGALYQQTDLLVDSKDGWQGMLPH